LRNDDLRDFTLPYPYRASLNCTIALRNWIRLCSAITKLDYGLRGHYIAIHNDATPSPQKTTRNRAVASQGSTVPMR